MSQIPIHPTGFVPTHNSTAKHPGLPALLPHSPSPGVGAGGSPPATSGQSQRPKSYSIDSILGDIVHRRGSMVGVNPAMLAAGAGHMPAVFPRSSSSPTPAGGFSLPHGAVPPHQAGLSLAFTPPGAARALQTWAGYPGPHLGAGHRGLPGHQLHSMSPESERHFPRASTPTSPQQTTDKLAGMCPQNLSRS